MKHISFLLMILAVFTFFGCDKGIQKYDTLVDKDETCNQLWANYESTLQRRADLIPNLVETVKAAAGSENKIIKEVMEARAKATQVTITPQAGDFEDPEKLKQHLQAQSGLGNTLSRLMMVQESYPELKSNENFRNLQTQIESTENRILRARQEYNKSVQAFNLELRRVSGKIVNPLTGHEFKPRAYFAADAGAVNAPKVNFTSETK